MYDYIISKEQKIYDFLENKYSNYAIHYHLIKIIEKSPKNSRKEAENIL